MRIREWIHRLLGTVRPRRHDEDLQAELSLHLELAAEEARRLGQTSTEANRTARIQAGGVAQTMNALRDQRGLPWLQSLGADLAFGWRQLNKHRSASAAAILSLGLAVGATTAAFRLVNAVLLRTLPVVEPERLFVLGWNSTTSQGDADYRDEFDYPTFRRYSEAVGAKAALMVVGMTGSPQQIVFDEAAETEPATRQYFSGNVFPTFGLQPALGRLLTPSDDVKPGGHPLAVISYDYWTRRFTRDPAVLGKTFRLGRQSFEVIGVSPRGFTGTEPGRMTDIFIPATMNVQALESPGFSWFRVWVRPQAGISPEQIRQPLQAEFIREHRNTVTRFPPDTPQRRIDAYLSEQVLLAPAGNGTSAPQRTLRRPLFILFGLVALVLLVACANVANLLTAQAVTRGREMALRVSIGAGRWRLMQLVLVESLLLAICASAAGAVFAWWAAPFVVSLLDFGVPVRLVLEADWRTVAFGLALTISVTVLFGLAPAARVSSVKPIDALTSRHHPPSHRRLTRSVIGAQMAFCVFVLFVAGLFLATFANLSNRPLGFEHEHVLLVDAQFGAGKQTPEVWAQLAEQIHAVPGVESVAQAMWVPLSESRWTASVGVAGQPAVANPAFLLGVSPGFFDTMRIGLIGGRDFRPGDTAPRLEKGAPSVPGMGIVNQAFARVHFNGDSPIGKQVTVYQSNDVSAAVEIVGLVEDSAYYNVREPMRPTVYVPTEARNQGTLVVRTTGDPLLLAPTLRRDVSRMRADLRVAVGPYSALIRRQMIRERLLATLSTFFAVVAVLLAGIGLYGVLNYAVIQQRREIGVRMALGARAAHVVKRVATEMLSPVGVGSVIGLAGGLAFGRVVQTLLFQVKATDPSAFMTPILTLAAAAALAALPPAIRAARTDPAQILRSE